MRKIASTISLMAVYTLMVIMGMLPFCFLLWNGIKKYDSKNWVEVVCEINDIRHYLSNQIEYSYEYDGKIYYNERIGIVDNGIGTLYKNYSMRLSKGKNKCYVNPRNPQESVMRRDWPMIYWFVLIAWSLIGGTVAFQGVNGIKSI